VAVDLVQRPGLSVDGDDPGEELVSAFRPGAGADVVRVAPRVDPLVQGCLSQSGVDEDAASSFGVDVGGAVAGGGDGGEACFGV
jgi:hypothetical protein